ncbi:MAG TPA: VanW family protein [Pyrinomonadaceae bacterium]|nr:VanW family protein [Pyrinomonadaceae bacterium]
MKAPATDNIHKRHQAVIFRGKASLLQLKRGVENLFDARLKRYSFSDKLKKASVIAESKTPLWTESAPEEQFLLAGKVHNLRLAVKKLNNLEIPAGEVFSFWKQIGQANRGRGFVVGRELREGCIIPNIGGGLCQLSNALYDAALQANFEIIERHAHTKVIPGSLAEQGRDATVFWNYIDLRFRSPNAFRIEAFLGKDHLTVRFKSDTKQKNFIQISKFKTQNSNAPQSCATCGVESCFRSLKPETNLDFGKTAFLVDEFSPELDEYIQKIRSKKDLLFLPLDGKRFRKANYAWSSEGFSKIKQSLFVTAVRSYKSRKLAAQGATRQKNLLAMYEKLAESYAENLPFDATHLVVQQNLLPFLWKNGALGGRTFDVLMTSLPMREIQKRLDFAFSLHPESKTLADFRADEDLIEAENESLQMARKIITPHAEIARLFPGKAELLDWKMPPAKKIVKSRNEKFTIVFPASTVGRKGCYELREAIRGLEVKLILLGAEIEGENFWRDFDVEKGGDDWLVKADLVVLPAFVEHKPRRLLQAVANKIPVIASEACGIGNIGETKMIKAGDAVALRESIAEFLIKTQTPEAVKL